MLALFTQFTLQCTEGCLKCNHLLNTCEFCDPTKNYKLDGGVCKQIEIKQCLSIDERGLC